MKTKIDACRHLDTMNSGPPCVPGVYYICVYLFYRINFTMRVPRSNKIHIYTNAHTHTFDGGYLLTRPVGNE